MNFTSLLSLILFHLRPTLRFSLATARNWWSKQKQAPIHSPDKILSKTLLKKRSYWWWPLIWWHCHIRLSSKCDNFKPKSHQLVCSQVASLRYVKISEFHTPVVAKRHHQDFSKSGGFNLKKKIPYSSGILYFFGSSCKRKTYYTEERDVKETLFLGKVNSFSGRYNCKVFFIPSKT